MDKYDLGRKFDLAISTFNKATENYTGENAELAEHICALAKGFKAAILEYISNN
ncbi:hypothetical protein IMSAG049_01129 [Clostridiales bacterium]|nr:hypothetical protein IMSAG049_01129 [Clostridiales bacterium]